ncbi:MAG: site-specific DNA-methyltransferase [Caldilineaceae bacterium]|nr:site-specific DNA-methyltransferase [Caldilineaceae bacterium]
MPTLNWIGKDAVVNHHEEVPFHLLRCDDALSVGEPGSGNLLVQGDNLTALKSLLPYYAGKVKCIYIDPPYNTGNEGWSYNDNVNSPEMQAWLGAVVGKEAEDLSRHDKWLSMMYPRLTLLRDLLGEDGSIWVSIDDNEVQNVRAILDEVFGASNFVATIIWQMMDSPKNTAVQFSTDHEYILLYAKSASVWRPNKLERTDAMLKRYKNPDNDPRGPWLLSDLAARNSYSAGRYSIHTPSGRVIEGPPAGSYWRVSKDRFDQLDADNRIWWGEAGDNRPGIKRFLSEVQAGVVPRTLWLWEDVGSTRHSKQELSKIMTASASEDLFITPKPSTLIQRILNIATSNDDIVLDSFAGTGTTGHAVLAQNEADGGNRRFILVEMEESVAVPVTRQRVQRVMEGYPHTGNERTQLFSEKLTVTNVRKSADLFAEIERIKKEHKDAYDKFENRIENGQLALYGVKRIDGFKPGLGGGFRYCRLGPTLFDAEGQIRPDVSYEELARHVFFSETGEPLTGEPLQAPLVGVHKERAVYLLFNGVLGDDRPERGNLLTRQALAALPAHNGPRIVYAEGCALSADYLTRHHTTFRQTPYQIRVR